VGTATARKFVHLSLALAGDEPPREFRIFTAGEVDTVKGRFVFDEAAAASVMAEYKAHGIDLMVDYDHASLGDSSADPALAGRAAGWFGLELRNGELWAVNVRWTPAADAALRAKEWRFMSPAFGLDGDRIASLLNVAITNLPATRQLEPLMAASAKGGGMSVEEFLKVCKALGVDMSGSLEDAMAKIKGEKPEAEEAPAEEPAAEAPADVAPMADKPVDEEKPAEAMAATSRLMRLTGKSSIVDAVAQVEIFRASHLELETERQALATERKTLEAAERRKLCAELVTLAGRAPAEVWADDAATAPKGYLAAMPLADLRAMHADAVKSSAKAPRIAAPKGAPVAAGAKEFSTPDGVVTLSASELKACAEAGAKVEDYAANKAARKARS
jgi:phage I-like protein